jgi:hypothetical protein
MAHNASHIDYKIDIPGFTDFQFGEGTDPEAYRRMVMGQQGMFESAYDIPIAGRSPYQSWLAEQWQTPASQYALGQAMAIKEVAEGGLWPTAGIGGGMAPVQGRTFEEYLQARKAAAPTRGQQRLGTLDPAYATAFAGLGPQAQRKIGAILPQYVTQTAEASGFQSQYAPMLAEGLYRQATSQPARRQYLLSQMEETADETFLNYLRRRHGIGATPPAPVEEPISGIGIGGTVGFATPTPLSEGDLDDLLAGPDVVKNGNEKITYSGDRLDAPFKGTRQQLKDFIETMTAPPGKVGELDAAGNIIWALP